MSHMSNVLGTINPASPRSSPQPMPVLACSVLLDGCQGGRAPQRRRASAGRRFLRLLRPQALWPDRHRRSLRQGRSAGCAGALSGRRRDDRGGRDGPHHLRRNPPHSVRSRHPADRFEAVGLGAAIRWLQTLDREAVAAHEHALYTRQVKTGLNGVNWIKEMGTAPDKGAHLRLQSSRAPTPTISPRYFGPLRGGGARRDPLRGTAYEEIWRHIERARLLRPI